MVANVAVYQNVNFYINVRVGAQVLILMVRDNMNWTIVCLKHDMVATTLEFAQHNSRYHILYFPKT